MIKKKYPRVVCRDRAVGLYVVANVATYSPRMARLMGFHSAREYARSVTPEERAILEKDWGPRDRLSSPFEDEHHIGDMIDVVGGTIRVPQELGFWTLEGDYRTIDPHEHAESYHHEFDGAWRQATMADLATCGIKPPIAE